jgi:hypothetical protein
MVAGLLLAGSLVVVYGCPESDTTSQGGAPAVVDEHAGHDHGDMPEGHPQMEEGMQGQMQMPESQPLNPDGEPMVGVWKNPNTGGSIRVTIEDGRLVYTGAYGSATLSKIDENHASGDMSGMPINLSLDGDTLSVELIGFNEVYVYERAG